MAFTISEFRGKALTNAGARANLFDVTIKGATIVKEWPYQCIKY